MKRDKKDEEAGGNIYANLDKTSVIQETRAFNETPINIPKCRGVLTKLLYLRLQEESIGRAEATRAFFAITKLWQTKDVTIRCLIYLAIKELSTASDDVIIATQSLMKDMTGREDLYRARAIRALCKIIDAGMLQTIERYMKQAIVDRNGSVSSAALVSSNHMMRQSAEIVRRWANEVQEAVSSDNQMVQYHALGLLYKIRSNDRLAVNKLVQKFSKSGLRSPYAVCYLIRIATKLLEEDDQADSALFQFIDTCLRHKSEMVVYEAASAIVSLPNTTPKELAPAISVLQLFCSSPKPSVRFAAVRTLNKVASKHPQSVTSCNVDLEKLITDPNRSIATLAITTLLKTGAESSVERLMKQISGFVSEISDEFKIVVVEAIRSLIARYPRKHTVMMPFLTNMLRNDGGFDYKKAIVETVIAIVEENPDARVAGLAQLCEFIEDCEHPSLATRVLHLLGREAPKTPNPQSYIRFVYNRVILECTQVRAAAVTALAKFGAQVAELRPSIEVLLRRCLLDSDDEVRDRATFYLYMLQQSSQIINNFILDQLQVSPIGLEKSLGAYVEEKKFDKPFDMRVVPIAAQPITHTEKPKPKLADPEDLKPKAPKKPEHSERLGALPQLAQLGPLFHSSSNIPLNDSVSEYTVQMIKHTFTNHIVLQFDCRNTVEDQRLVEVAVVLEEQGDEPEWQITDRIDIDALPYGETRSAYLVLEYPDSGAVVGQFECSLKFKVKDVDPKTGEPESDDTYDDQYVLEEVDIGVSDSVQPLVRQHFNAGWEKLEGAAEIDQTFALSSVSTLEEAIKKVSELLGVAACERSDLVPEGKSNHQALLAGVFRGGHEVLVKAKAAIDPTDGTINMNIVIRSDDDGVADVLGSALN
ncbi:unnamed protein product, partial [Mesorhabditis belari]|uniref:Coatomer subunit gamma n=1 Tax=Mesorhabditis belari TaxID=2138241 RepID=A0AAF3EEN5_9BILA